MPARSVVIERFTKYGGAGRATLTSGEYLQLTGRAGRRGLDEEGHAVALWSSETAFSEAARVASAPPPDLRSSFRPTYNLAVNLASRFDRETANDVLRRSFAQWQAQRADLLTIQLSHRVAVLEDLGYLKDWSLTPTGPPAVPDLPRVRSAAGRGPGRRPLRRCRALGAGRGGVGGRLRAPPRPTPGRPAVPGPVRLPGAAGARDRWRIGWGRSGWPSWNGGVPRSSTWPNGSGRSKSSISFPVPGNRLPAWPPP